MFFNFKVCLTTCLCSFKEIKVGYYEILLSVGFEILGLGRPILYGSLQG